MHLSHSHTLTLMLSAPSRTTIDLSPFDSCQNNYYFALLESGMVRHLSHLVHVHQSVSPFRRFHVVTRENAQDQVIAPSLSRLQRHIREGGEARQPHIQSLSPKKHEFVDCRWSWIAIGASLRVSIGICGVQCEGECIDNDTQVHFNSFSFGS